MSNTNSEFTKMWDDFSLRPYLGEISRRHGIIESIALPSMHDLPPLRIETLFVSPLLAETPVSADSDPKTWPEGRSLLQSMQSHRQLVVLGDPGGGKTTLSNWLAWRLSAGLTSPLPPFLEDRVPLPCVLREMPSVVFTSELTLPELAVTIAVRLLGDKADEALKTSLRTRVRDGNYVLILDGVDEIPVSHRKVVAGWVKKAFEQNASMLATSRIVGYEDGPVDREVSERTKKSESKEVVCNELAMRLSDIDISVEIEGFDASPKKVDLRKKMPEWAQRRYLMPFDQDRIAAFAENWYRQRCGSEQEARQKAGDLLAALAQSDTTRQLARTPNLLSLMAIVHRERAHLPDGKALLYEEIANAYINTIDKQRKILPGDALVDFTWKDRKAWLAYVGFQMQLLRGNQQEDDESDNEETDAGVLVDERDVLKWLAEAMRISGVAQPQEIARTFLSWVARRSGLLLPRGEKRFAFVHLSFQEYFCACYLDARIGSRAFIHNKLTGDDPATRPKLAEWSKRSVWRETLVYLFELQSAEREADWLDDLAEILFGDDESQFEEEQAALAVRVLVDRHIRLGNGWKDRLADRCITTAHSEWQWSGRHQEPIILLALFATEYAVLVGDDTDEIPEPFRTTQKSAKLEDIPEKSRLCFVANKNIGDIAPLAALKNLRLLDLSNSQVTDVAPLTGLGNLQVLALSNTKVADVTPLAGLGNLQKLELNNTAVVDVTPLAGLGNLQYLELTNTDVADVTPLAELGNLEHLDLGNTKVVDVTLLVGLGKLLLLNLFRTAVADVAPLAGLGNLQYLFLSGTSVADVTQLARLGKLQHLALSNTKVADVTPLAGLGNLKYLILSNSKVTDVTSLAGLGNLQHLDLSNSKVKDVTSLTGLGNLRYLDLSNSKVTDVSPLAGLNDLYFLRLENSKVKDVSSLAGNIGLHIMGIPTADKKLKKPRKSSKKS